MSTSLFRIASLILVPCLIADPATVVSFHKPTYQKQSWLLSNNVSAIFSVEALAEQETSSRNPDIGQNAICSLDRMESAARNPSELSPEKRLTAAREQQLLEEARRKWTEMGFADFTPNLNVFRSDAREAMRALRNQGTYSGNWTLFLEGLSQPGSEAWHALLEKLLVGYTGVFRFPWQYSFVETILPELYDRSFGIASPLLFLSLGSSDGMEVFSLGSTILAESDHQHRSSTTSSGLAHPIVLRGVDLRRNAIEKALTYLKMGRLEPISMTPDFQKFFHPIKGLRTDWGLPKFLQDRVKGHNSFIMHIAALVAVEHYVQRMQDFVSFVEGDIVSAPVVADIGKADVIFINEVAYLMSREQIIQRLGPALNEMKAGGYLISSVSRRDAAAKLGVDFRLFDVINKSSIGTVLRRNALVLSEIGSRHTNSISNKRMREAV